MPCQINTFEIPLPSVNFMATRQPVSRNIIAKTQEAALDPRLKKCGRMAICEGCEIGAYAQLLETTARVAERIKNEF